MIDLFNTLANYFNTANESPEKVKEHKEDTSVQNQKIYNYFLINKGIEFSSSDLMSENVLDKDTPITSYRRAVNTLMNKGLIEQSGRKSIKYDRLEYTYKLSTK
jgi:hypothetical protein